MNNDLMTIICNIELGTLRDLNPTMIFYGANTCWWTHDPTHLGHTKPVEAEVIASAKMLRMNSSTPDAPLDEYLERARRVHTTGLPCDPRGGVLFQTDDVKGFLDAAIANQEHYGKHRLRAFMAAHHSNCWLGINGQQHWCSPDWQDYNDALDRLDHFTATTGRPLTSF
jgi:hypothetical protein